MNAEIFHFSYFEVVFHWRSSSFAAIFYFGFVPYALVNKHKCVQKVAKVDLYTVCQSHKDEQNVNLINQSKDQILFAKEEISTIIIIRTC